MWPKIVAYREEKGPFKERQELLKVSGLGPKTFIQCAGFLRIPDGENCWIIQEFILNLMT